MHHDPARFRLLQTAKDAEAAAALGGAGPGPGRLLWAFLERFGRRFDYDREAISIPMVRRGG